MLREEGGESTYAGDQNHIIAPFALNRKEAQDVLCGFRRNVDSEIELRDTDASNLIRLREVI